MDLPSLTAIADSIALLFRPHAEVVIHDLLQGKVIHIAGGFSKRSAGDSSLNEIEDMSTLYENVIGPYSKTNWDGRRTKSTTTVIRNTSNTPVGLMCINLDVSQFEAMQDIFREFLSCEIKKDRSTALFRDDWREDVNEIIGQYVTEHATTPAHLNRSQRVNLIALLDTRGLFEVRNAIPYIASLLSLSRATLYKSLTSARELTKPKETL